MANNHIPDAALAELDRLHEAAIKGMNWQEVAQFQAMITEQYQPLRQRLTDAESRLAEAERLRGVVNDLGEMLGDVRKQRDAVTARAEAAEALVAGLRGALEEAGDVIHACFCETEEIRGKVCHPSCTAINAALALTPASAEARIKAEARKDNEELDGTDAAHPAWWRGNDAGVAQVCAQINAILDGADVSGTASEPWESTRRRVAEARKDLERLREVLESGKADRWAATVGNTETNAFRPSGWVVRAEAALALIPASAAARLKAEAE